MFTMYESNAEMEYRRERLTSAFRRADRHTRRGRMPHHRHLPRRHPVDQL